jgi:DNA polymerase
MTRRRLILEEMGLGPLWRLRESRETRPTEEAQSTPHVIRHPQPPPNVSPARRSDIAGRPVEGPSAVRDASQAGARRAAILAMDWEALRSSVTQCVACPLHQKRTNTVFGVGDERADWLFVGEGPGAEEDAKGEPFVGQAGRLLDNMLAAIDLKRGENVYIANVVKCRPPGNRNPESGEMSCCEPYLTRQIALLKPRLVVAMGRIASSHLLQTDQSIASLRGKLHDYQGITLIVTYHPAYLLRNLPDKAKSWADLCLARDTMRSLTENVAA